MVTERKTKIAFSYQKSNFKFKLIKIKFSFIIANFQFRKNIYRIQYCKLYVFCSEMNLSSYLDCVFYHILSSRQGHKARKNSNEPLHCVSSDSNGKIDCPYKIVGRGIFVSFFQWEAKQRTEGKHITMLASP